MVHTGEPFKNEVVIPATAQFEPDGEYTLDATIRRPGEQKPLDPTNVNIIPSVLPSIIIPTPCEKKEQAEAVTKIETFDNNTPQPEVGGKFVVFHSTPTKGYWKWSWAS